MTTDTTQVQRQINEYSDELQQRQHNLVQPFPARYYHLMSDDGQLEATMVVVLDSRGRAMQAVLRYDPMLPTPTQNKVRRRAENVLRSKFLGSSASTPLYVYEAGRALDSVNVDHTGEDAAAGSEGSVNLLYVTLGILGMFVVFGLLFWLLNSLFRGRQEVAAPTATPLAIVQPAAAAPAVATPTTDVTAPGIQTNGLPTSKLANPAIGVGGTVRIRDELRSFVRSEPGVESGEIVGYMEDGDTAVVIGGPTWLQGDSDTIVWWLVRLPDGLEGWTPANTSQLTLLDPV
jgi:hypothetical protein